MNKKELRAKVNQRLGVKTKKEAIKLIKHKVLTDNRWLFRSIIAIYNKQAEVEKKTKEAMLSNGMGFSAYDANYMSNISELIIRGKRLSSEQLLCARGIMQKYCGQLYSIALCKITNIK